MPVHASQKSENPRGRYPLGFSIPNYVPCKLTRTEGLSRPRLLPSHFFSSSSSHLQIKYEKIPASVEIRNDTMPSMRVTSSAPKESAALSVYQKIHRSTRYAERIGIKTDASVRKWRADSAVKANRESN